MARRRRLGRALAGVSDALGMLLQDQLLRRRQSDLRDIIGEQQRVAEGATTERQVVMKALDDPQVARRLVRGGVARLGGVDLSGLADTDAERSAPVRRQIGQAASLSALPTTADVVGLRAAEGPIESLPDITGLLEQRHARAGELERVAPRKPQAYVDEQGTEFTRYLPEHEMGQSGSLQTGRSLQQEIDLEGQKRGATKRAELAPDIVTGEVRRAGQIAGTEAAARAPYDTSPSVPREWVIRDGQQLFLPESDVQPGDKSANIREQGRPVTSGDAGRIAELKTSLSDLAVLRGTVSERGATGTAAKVGAMLPNWVTEWTGVGASAKSKQGVIDRVKQVIGKALEGGVLRKEDEYKYEKILPTIGDVPAVVKTKLDGLDMAIRQRLSTFVDALRDADYDVSGFQNGMQMPTEVDGVPIRVR